MRLDEFITGGDKGDAEAGKDRRSNNPYRCKRCQPCCRDHFARVQDDRPRRRVLASTTDMVSSPDASGRRSRHGD